MMKKPSHQAIWEFFANLTLKHDRLIIFILAAITLFFIYGLTKIEIGTYIRDFHQKQSLDLIDTVELDFDQSGYVSIIFETQTDESLLTPKMLKAQFHILQEIKKKYNVTIHSLVTGLDEGLKRAKNKTLLEVTSYDDIGEAFLSMSGSRSVWDLEKVSQHFLSHPEVSTFYQRFRASYYFSPKQGSGTLKFKVPYLKALKSYVQIDTSLNDRQKRQTLVGIRELIDQLTTPELKGYVYDNDLISYDIDKQSEQNATTMGLALILINVLILYVLYKNLKEILLTLSIVILACIWTYGLMGHLGISLSFMHLIVLPILLGTGIDDSVVFTKRFSEEWGKNNSQRSMVNSQFGEGDFETEKKRVWEKFSLVLKETYSSTGMGIFLTTFTTFVAFLCGAFVALTKVMLSFYLLVTFAMVVALILTLLLQGSIRALLIKKNQLIVISPSAGQGKLTKFILTSLPKLASRLSGKFSRNFYIILALILLGLSLFSSHFVDTEFKRKMFMRKSMPVYTANKLDSKYFGKSDVGFVLIEGDVANLDLLLKMRELRKWMDDYPIVRKIHNKAFVESINDLIDKLKPEATRKESITQIYDRILNTNETANLILDETFPESAQKVLRKRNGQYDGLVIKFFVKYFDAKLTRKLVQDMYVKMKDLGFDQIPGITYRIGAGDIALALEEDYYFNNFIHSFFVTLLLNFIVLLVIWRRFWQSLFATIPVILAVFITLGLLPILGLKLNMINICIGAIAVGMGIDYPIHLLERFNEEKLKHPQFTDKELVQLVLDNMGPNIFGASLTTTVGFFTACLLALPVAKSFGILTATALLLTYLFSIFFLSALLIKKLPRKSRSP